MPTGYTAAVAEGRVTGLKEFALSCVGSLSLFCDLRDQPVGADIPEIMADTTYEDEQIKEAETRMANLRSMSAADAQAELEKLQVKASEYNRRRTEEVAVLSKRYSDMTDKVEAWVPPSSDHVYLKDFMLAQLRSSRDSDCRLCLDTIPDVDRAAAEKWLAESLNDCADDIFRYKKQILSKVNRVWERNEYLRLLKASL